MPWTLLLGAAGWYALGLAGSGFMVADLVAADVRFGVWSDEELARTRREHVGVSLVMAVLGPGNLIACFCLSGFGQHGWTLRLNQ